MIRAALLMLAIAIVGASEVSAQTIMGAGMISCGEWTRLRSVEGREGRDLASVYQIRAWVDGFISGINSANNSHPDLLASHPDAAALYAWVDNYCRSKPLNVVAQAVDALVKELESRATPRGMQR